MFGRGRADRTRKRTEADADKGRGLGSLGKATEGFKVPQDLHCNLLLKWNMRVDETRRRGGVLT